MANKLTNTTIFIVPLLKIGNEKLETHNFINAYSEDKQKEGIYRNAVFLLFKPQSNHSFSQFVNEEQERGVWIDDYDYEDGYVVLVYKMPEIAENDLKLLKSGQYSKTSKSFKNKYTQVKKIVKNNKHYDEISLQWQIFLKDNNLRGYWEDKIGVSLKEDMEVWKTWDESEEILNINDIINDKSTTISK